MKKTTLTLLAILAAASTPLATAHGDAAHMKKTAAVKKEQTDWGIAGDAKAVKRTVTLTMSDAMRFTPDFIQVKQGETLKLVIHNGGAVLHELVIGTPQVLEEHAALMVKFPNMEHDEPYMAHVASGTRSEMIWTFNRTGDFDFACLIAGHFQAGMVGKIHVASSK